MSDEPALRCAELSVSYGATKAVDGIDLSVARGAVLALLGASGSGKSTLLHAIAGLIHPSAGSIWIGGRQVTGAGRDVGPERRNVGLVFQDFALWPHLCALDTVAYPLRRAGLHRRAARDVARRMLDALDIGPLADRHPTQLSGGQQQRVGLARALARDPEVFLLDEPTAHLDTHLRGAFQESVRERQAASGAAAVYATHDAGEALAVADRVALLAAGRLVQIGSPESVYAEPVSEAAAALTGEYSVVQAQVSAPAPGRLSVDFGSGPVELPGAGAGHSEPRPRRLLLRPEWLQPGGQFRSMIVMRTFRGGHTDYHLDADGARVLVRVPGAAHRSPGEVMAWGIDRAWVLPDDAGRSVQPSAAIAPA